MTTDTTTIGRALELLASGHRLYLGDRVDPGPVGSVDRLPADPDRLDRLAGSSAMRAAVVRVGQLRDGLRQMATADAGLAGLLVSAAADHERGRGRTGAVLAAAHADRMPAADTPMGRREAQRRMLNRLRTQRRAIVGSRRRARQLARGLSLPGYPRHRKAARNGPAPGVVGVDAVRYRPTAPPGGVRQWIAAALDRLGIDDPGARRNWSHGYHTLIARESGGRAAAVASEPAGAPGPIQPDGHGLGYARGLTQTIPTTFAAYHQPGTSTNIYDPVANICASMNYVMQHYGVSPDGANLAALVQQADSRRAPRGY